MAAGNGTNSTPLGMVGVVFVRAAESTKHKDDELHRSVLARLLGLGRSTR